MLILTLTSCLGCVKRPESQDNGAIRIATSYSLEDSGLFAALAAAFTRQTTLRLKPSFVGSGKALALGRDGKVDVVLVHSRQEEDAFIAEGFGVNRRAVMYGEFVILGPRRDPAKIRGSSGVGQALTAIAAARARFLSRGDGSGNHAREQALWALAGVKPAAPWYVDEASGMLELLRRASREGAYVLADRPTFIVNRSALELEVLFDGDSQLHNPYSVIAVNPLRVPGVDYDGSLRFIDFLCSASGQAIIRDFGRDKFGEPLFVPFQLRE